MNRRLLSAWLGALALAAFAVPEGAFAQDNPLDPTVPKSQVLVGPRIGINRNFHTGGFRTINDPNCPVFESGSGFGFLAGFTAEFVMGESWTLVPAVVYESRPGSFTQELPNAKVLLPGQETPVDQTVSTTSDITFSMLSAEVMYKQDFATFSKGFRLSATVGPTAAYVLGGKITQVQDLHEPQNAVFINPDPAKIESRNFGRQLVFSDNDDIPGRASLRFSVKAGVQAELGLFNNQWILYPGVFYDYGLTDVTENENWNLSSLIFQVDLRRAF